tara:strand:- start:659 stop:949 length:291 start_codon:yes stop_codon:yes gene_type:complete
MIDRNKDYSKINSEREERAKALHIADVSGSYSGVGKTCDTCIFWKRYMLRSQPNTTHLDEKFPCQHKDIQALPTDIFYKVGVTKKDDSCVRWQYDR